MLHNMIAELETSARKLYIETFGCQMNKLDSELVAGQLRAEGFEATEDRGAADLILYNTCSVRQRAEDKVSSHLGHLKRAKAERPGLVIGVMGCMAQRESDQILSRFPQVDLVVGSMQIHNIRTFVREVFSTGRRISAVELDQVQFHRDVTTRPNPFQAFVSVMRGCDVMCTFCVVPFTRGKERSRSKEDILDEVRRLADGGCLEVTFLGQTVNSYGKRLDQKSSLAELLAGAAAIDGIRRVRYITSHPNFMTPDLIEVMGGEPKVCPYLHLPVQHGDNEMLERMRRGYTVEQYLEVTDRVRDAVPDLALASDFIVGFPGETEEAFDKTVALLRERKFQNSFIFKYSPRPQTVAARNMVDDVPVQIKRERNQMLLKAQEQVSRARLTSQIGRSVEVLVEGGSKKDASKLFGRTPQFEIVVFEGPTSLTGQLVTVEIDSATPLTLFGLLQEESCRERTTPSGTASS